MKALFSFVSPLDFLRKENPLLLPPLEEIIQEILKQTVECIVFIHAYSGHGTAGVGYAVQSLAFPEV